MAAVGLGRQHRLRELAARPSNVNYHHAARSVTGDRPVRPSAGPEEGRSGRFGFAGSSPPRLRSHQIAVDLERRVGVEHAADRSAQGPTAASGSHGRDRRRFKTRPQVHAARRWPSRWSCRHRVTKRVLGRRRQLGVAAGLEIWSGGGTGRRGARRGGGLDVDRDRRPNPPCHSCNCAVRCRSV